MQTLIKCKYAYNMQVSQDCKTHRWSRITLLSDPEAKLINMIVHMFSASSLCVGVSNSDPSKNWATQLEDAWNKLGFVEKLNQFILPRILWCFHSRRQEAYSVISEWANSGIFWMRGSDSWQCSVTLNGQGKEIQKLVCTLPEKWWLLRPNSSQDTGASWGPAPEDTSWNGNSNELPRTLGYYRKVDGWTYSMVTNHIQYFWRQNHCRLDS